MCSGSATVTTGNQTGPSSFVSDAPKTPSLFDQQLQQAGLQARRRLRGASGYQSMFLSGLDGTQKLGV